MFYPEGTVYSNSKLSAVATAETNDFGDSIFFNHGTKSRCVVIGGKLYSDAVAKTVHEHLSKEVAPALLSALKQALRHARDAMPVVERTLFDDRKSGPEWMFYARDAISLTE